MAADIAAELWSAQDGQDIAEYAVMLAVILVVGSHANSVFSSAASSVQ